jgi:hypothetical protein
MTIFSEDFFEVLHISVGPKIKILENRSNFLNFSVDMPDHLNTNYKVEKMLV